MFYFAVRNFVGFFIIDSTDLNAEETIEKIISYIKR